MAERTCTTHHNACECRQRRYDELVRAARALVTMNERQPVSSAVITSHRKAAQERLAKAVEDL